ncbi:MAG: DMT family transporter [Pseudomonadota bacterium]
MSLPLALAMALTMCAFTANSLLNRLALADGEAGPASFAALRLVSGAVVLVLLIVLRNPVGRLKANMNLGNALALATYILGFSFAYVTLDAGFGALLLFGTVQLTMFSSVVFTNSEAIPIRRWVGAAMALAGLLWLLAPSSAESVSLSPAALLMVLAGIGWGIYSLRGSRGTDPLAATAASFLLATPVALVVYGMRPDTLNWRGAGLACVSGALTSGLGYALWYRLLPQINATVAAVAQLTVPVLAAVAGVFILGEPFGVRLVLSGALVLGGVLIATVRIFVPR